MSAADAGHAAWLSKGDHDLHAVDILLAGERPLWDIVTFHAQQAAEKYLKGFLVSCGQRPPKIHDLSRLLDLCLSPEPTLSSLRSDCIELTDAGYQSRYPDIPDRLGEHECTTAVAAARRICDAVRRALASREPQ